MLRQCRQVLATTIWLDPRCTPCPLLTAAARFCQNAAPVPPILSYTSIGPPGNDTVSRHVAACEPVASVTEIWLPRLPVYSAVNRKFVFGIRNCAAVSVPSVARTQRKFAAPCCTAVATCVAMSNLRATIGPKLLA